MLFEKRIANCLAYILSPMLYFCVFHNVCQCARASNIIGMLIVAH